MRKLRKKIEASKIWIWSRGRWYFPMLLGECYGPSTKPAVIKRYKPLSSGTRSFGGGWKPPQWRGCSQSRQHGDNLRAKSQGTTIRYHPVMGLNMTWTGHRQDKSFPKLGENEHPFPGRLLPKRRFYLGSCHLGPGQRITFVIFQRNLILNGLYSKFNPPRRPCEMALGNITLTRKERYCLVLTLWMEQNNFHHAEVLMNR